MKFSDVTKFLGFIFENLEFLIQYTSLYHISPLETKHDTGVLLSINIYLFIPFLLEVWIAFKLLKHIQLAELIRKRKF